jgi:hypothetical protein
MVHNNVTSKGTAQEAQENQQSIMLMLNKLVFFISRHTIFSLYHYRFTRQERKGFMKGNYVF